jgi:hypothetical protein
LGWLHAAFAYDLSAQPAFRALNFALSFHRRFTKDWRITFVDVADMVDQRRGAAWLAVTVSVVARKRIAKHFSKLRW